MGNHRGVFSCYRALADYSPETDVFVAFTGNVRTGGIDILRLAMPQLVAGQDLGPAQVPAHEAIEVPVETLETLVGAYQIPGNELEMRPSPRDSTKSSMSAALRRRKDEQPHGAAHNTGCQREDR